MEQDLYDISTLTDGELNRQIANLDTQIMAVTGDPDRTTRLEQHRRALRDEQDKRLNSRRERKPDGTGRLFPEVEHPPHH